MGATFLKKQLVWEISKELGEGDRVCFLLYRRGFFLIFCQSFSNNGTDTMNTRHLEKRVALTKVQSQKLDLQLHVSLIEEAEIDHKTILDYLASERTRKNTLHRMRLVMLEIELEEKRKMWPSVFT